MAQTHELKTLDIYFDAVARGEKTFEVRRNDRAFQTGDTLKLISVNETGFKRIATDPIIKRISYLLQGGQFGIEPGYCVLGLSDIKEHTNEQE